MEQLQAIYKMLGENTIKGVNKSKANLYIHPKMPNCIFVKVINAVIDESGGVMTEMKSFKINKDGTSTNLDKLYNSNEQLGLFSDLLEINLDNKGNIVI